MSDDKSNKTSTPQFGLGSSLDSSNQHQTEADCLDTKTQFNLLEIIENLARNKLSSGTFDSSNICYKIQQSKQYIQIKLECYFI